MGMARSSRLMFAAERSGHASHAGEAICECEDGIPLGWLMCFGGRNFWAPDDMVADRGGTAAERDRFETPLEVADARMAQAIDGLRGCPHLWVWLAPVQVLHRRVQSRGKRGFLRLDAGWAFAGAGGELMNSLPSYVENYVNMAVASRPADIARIAAPIEKISPFVPVCRPDDRKRFEKAAAYRTETDVRRVAALIVGTPAGDRDAWRARVEQIAGPEFARLASLPPYPAMPDAPPAEQSSFMARLKGLVGRK